ncbi:MAG: hypothetical protein K8I02_08110, partial [Candidatus Methylomirabilis sp.]|nr:hypothetical protein [Deltaproteobacteria bacterium]
TWMRRGYDDVIRPDLFAWIEARRAEDLPSLSAESLAASIEDGVERIQSIYAEHQLGDIFSIFPIKMIERLVRLAGGDPFPFFESTRAEVESIYRRQSEIDLLRYAEGEIPLETILRDHGWRGSPEWEFAEPRWREAPETLLAEEAARIRAHYGVRDAKELKTSERTIAEARGMLFGLLTRAVARTGVFQWLIRRFFRDFILWAEIKERAWYDCVRVVDVLRARMEGVLRRGAAAR